MSPMTALQSTEATLSVRVIRKDGTEETVDSVPVVIEVTPEIAAALEEYKALGQRMRELEKFILGV